MAFKRSAVRSRLSPPHERYTNTISKASLAVYGAWFALIIKIDGYEGEFYPETKLPTCKEIRGWIKEMSNPRIADKVFCRIKEGIDGCILTVRNMILAVKDPLKVNSFR